ncbi:ABC transporter permease subunit [Kineococcus sp. R8]|nr:ABC transporter permease subunit [Kineococcus siccus]
MRTRGRRRAPDWAPGAAGCLAVLLAWALVSVTVFRTSGAVPTPWSVVAELGRSGWSFYAQNVGVTVRGAALGYLYGNVVALAVAVLVLLVPAFDGLASQLAVISYCMPLTAIGPIVLVVFGGRTPTVFLAAISCIFTTLIGALLGLRAADPVALDLVRGFGGGRVQQVVRVQLVAALPSLVAALRIAAPAAMLGAVVGEYLGGVDSGLGVVLTVAQQQNDVPRTWALAVVCGLVAALAYLLLGVLGRLVTPWARTAEERP